METLLRAESNNLPRAGGDAEIHEGIAADRGRAAPGPAALPGQVAGTFAIAGAPLRVSLAGGGSDLPEYWGFPGRTGRTGRVVSFAIGEYIWVTISRRWEKEMVVSYREMEIVENAGAVRHPLVREALFAYGLPKTHLEVHLVATLPGRGTGLGSSSALAVALVEACLCFMGRQLYGEFSDWRCLAKQAFLLERAAGVKVGLQDHCAAACGGLNMFWFERNEFGGIPIAPPPGLTDFLMLFRVAERETPAEAILAEQASAIENDRCMAELLDFVSWSAIEMCAALRAADYGEMGRLLHEGWRRKGKFSRLVVSEPVKIAYQAARQAGALGGKICGAGGGGFLLLCAEPEKQEAVRFAMAQLGHPELRFNLEPWRK